MFDIANEVDAVDDNIGSDAAADCVDATDNSFISTLSFRQLMI